MRPAISALEHMYLTSTCTAIAEETGATAATIRKMFSNHGIADPKREAVEKRRRVIASLFDRGWSIADIAFQMEMDTAHVRADITRMGLQRRDNTQLALWKDHEFRITPKPRLEIVHRARRSKVVAVQLEMFNEQTKAA